MSKKSVVAKMAEVRAATWLVEGRSADGEWRVIYHGPYMRTAMNAVHDHDETRVSYHYGTWREINDRPDTYRS